MSEQDKSVLEWKEAALEPPSEGETVIVCNSVKEWVTTWNTALMSSYARYPVTHYARYARPYDATEPDLTKIDEKRSRSRLDNAIQSARKKGMKV